MPLTMQPSYPLTASNAASSDALQPVSSVSAAPRQEAHRANRSFAELLSDAESVQDFVTLHYTHTPQSGPLVGWLRGAMPLWLLRRMQGER